MTVLKTSNSYELLVHSLHCVLQLTSLNPNHHVQNVTKWNLPRQSQNSLQLLKWPISSSHPMYIFLTRKISWSKRWGKFDEIFFFQKFLSSELISVVLVKSWPEHKNVFESLKNAKLNENADDSKKRNGIKRSNFSKSLNRDSFYKPFWQ